MKRMGLLRWLIGAVSFEGEIIESYSRPEEFLNQLTLYGVKVWDISIENGKLTGMANCHHYLALVRCGKRAGIRIRKTEKHGAPFFLHRYRKRWGILVGILLFIGVIVYSQNFIWEIKFPEMEEKEKAYLSQTMEEMGLCEGAYIPNLDIPKLQRDLLMKMEEISWIAFNIDGTKLTVELSQKVEPPEENERIPFNIIAAKSGQILSMEVYEGKKIVKVKDVVHAGDLLVSGAVDVPRGEGVYYTNSSAKIIAATTTKVTLSFSLTQEEQVFTGEEEKRYYLNFFGLKIPLFVAFPLPEPYETEETFTPLKIKETPLPLGLWEETNRFYRMEERTYTTDEGKKALEEGFLAYEQEEHSDCKITNRRDHFTKEGNKLFVTRQYSCEEDIAQREALKVEGEVVTKY